MKKVYLFLVFISCFLISAVSQIKFSDVTKKFIEYNDSITVFKNALLIDGKGNAAKPHQTIIISNGKISWVGDDSIAIIPKGANTVDLIGKALMPGLVMLHEHMYITAPSYTPTLKQLPITFPRLYLAAGATTIKTCGSIEPYSDLRIKNDIDSGKLPGPSLVLTAPYVEGKHSSFAQMNELKNVGDATSFVNYWADQGFTTFKAYQNIDRPTLQAAIEAAHKRHLKMTGHLCAVNYREAAAMGIDNLEHGFMVSTDFVKDKKENECPEYNANLQSLANLNVNSDSVKNLLKFLIDRKVGVTSTLAVFESSTSANPAPSYAALQAMSPDTRDFYLQNYAYEKAYFTSLSEEAKISDKAFNNGTKMEKMFYTMGGLLTVGTDPTGDGGTLAGYGNWRAIELLVEADGFTPLEAIKIATKNGSIALGFDKTIGTIETGKSADLLIVDGDPSKNITDIRKILYVYKNGVGYNSKKLFESVKGRVGLD